MLRCPDGVLGLFDCSIGQQFRVQAEVVGTEGALVVERPYLVTAESRLRLCRDYDEQEFTSPEPDPYRCEVESVAAAVLDGAPLPVPLESSRANVATLVRLYASARSGKPLP
jgi:predicted dehydrogenase